MRRLWTTASLALSLSLSCAVLCLASPQPRPQPELQQSWQGLQQQEQQQRPLTSFHRNRRPQHNSNSDNNDTGTYARFDGEQVLRMELSSPEQLKRLEAIVEEHNLDLWSYLRIGNVDVRVPSDKLEAFKAATSTIPSTVMIPNLQNLVPEHAPASLLHTKQQQNNWNFTDNSFWHNYHDFETLNNFTEAMVQQYPDLVKRVSIGHTYEGREIFGMSIHGFKPKKKKKKKADLSDHHSWDVDEEENDDEEVDMEETNKKFTSWRSWIPGYARRMAKKPSKPKKHPKAIIIHAGQHAREWIGPAVVTYIAKELILGYRNNKKITRLVNQFEFVIVPLLNADGYVYTWETNRMWRKNRQPTSIPFCPGVDPNRSWGYMWNTGGGSSNPCSEGYTGPEAFSALEAKMMADYISKRKNVIAYLDFHAYAQLWMSPFGGDCTKVPRDDEDIVEASMGAVKALQSVNGKKFTVGSVCNVFERISGNSIDWTYGVADVKYSYFVQLRDTGLYGFLLPETEILPSSKETMAAVTYLGNFIRVREKQWGNLD